MIPRARTFGGNVRDRSLSRGLEATQSHLYSHGAIVTKGESLQTAVNLLGSNGGTLYIEAGTWDINGTLYLTSNNIHLKTLGNVTFRRAASTAGTRGIISIEGDNCSIDNLTIDDASTSATTTISVTGDNCKVSNCTFLDADVAITCTSANRVMLHDNRVIASRDATYGFLLTGTSSRNLVRGNSFESSPVNCIYAGDLVTVSSFYGNVQSSGATNVLNILAVGAHEESSNITNVNVR